MTERRFVRTIAGGAGFAGDRIDPAVRLAASGRVNAIGLECLAERTLVPGLRARRLDPSRGADPRIARRMTPLLGPAVANRCRIITNFGAANPAAAAAQVAALARSQGLQRVRVAAVTGDDVLHLTRQIRWDGSVDGDLIGAHAYIGTDAIAAAAQEGADVIVTGRAADSALFAGDLLPHLDGSDDALAGAIMLGHLLECSGQLTGGNFEAPGPGALTAADYACLGFPVADVMRDGTAEIGVLDGSPGRIDRLTTTLQLLYEVHNPGAYITPDLIVDFSNVLIEEIGPQRVRVSGARPAGRPADFKVSGFVDRPGAVADVEFGFVGIGALDRARIAADTIRLRLSDIADEDIRVDLVGVNSVLGPLSAPGSDRIAEVRVHVSARFDDAANAGVVEDEAFGLSLSGPAAACSFRSETRPRLEIVNGFVARELVETTVEWQLS
ncbi:MAG: acyclic terpene utilization AtuA family protein [Pseudomonadota bacterium]